MSVSVRLSVKATGAVLAALLLLVAPAMAGVNGKIAGVVIDKKTKEPLINAAIQIQGTKIGALTDVDGKYQIMAVPASEYTIAVKIVGYTGVVTQGVLVKPDLTTTLNLELEQSLIELQPIVVTRERELIQMDEATTKRDVTAEKIKSMPVANVSDIVKKFTGVTVRNDRFHVRGGRSDEVLFTVDGVSMKDPLGGRGPTESLNLSGTEIENISIIKGGWSAEYGEATSGIINVATKEGEHDVTRGHAEYFTDNLGTTALNKYSFNLNRLEFTLGGPDPLITSRLLPQLGLQSLAGKLSYFINADFDKTDTYTPINDYTTPLTRAKFRYTKFLGLEIPDRQENTGNAGLKLTYRLNPDIRVTGIFKRSDERSLAWGWAYRYTPNTLPWIEDRNDRYSLTWTHNLSRSTFYQVVFSRVQRLYQQKPGDPTTPGGTLNPDQFLFPAQADHYIDGNNNGQWDPPEEWVDVYPDGVFNVGEPYVDANGNGQWDQGENLLYDFNGNGVQDNDVTEPFVDRNGNGRYDGVIAVSGGQRFGTSDFLESDGNRNGRYDPLRERDLFGSKTGQSVNDRAESFIDGDISLGEPFVDINRNGVWDAATTKFDDNGKRVLVPEEPYTDLSYDSKYDGPFDPWVPGVPFRDYNGNGVYDKGRGQFSGGISNNDVDYRLGDPFYDLNGNGIRDPLNDGFFERGWDEDVLWSRKNVITSTIDMDLTSQVRREQEVKVGFSFKAYSLNLEELTKPYVPYTGTSDGGPYPDHGSVRDFYTQTPKSGAFYLRDKMEYGQMIANLGFRYDYFIQSKNASITGTGLGGEFTGRPKAEDYRDKFAPRIAFSYPISDKAKVFFNYGHFYQLPQLTYMYQRATQLSSATGVIGNVNLDYERTIQYEFGVQYLLSPTYVLSVQGYYKDDFGRVTASAATGNVATATRNFYENRDYARARGLELELEKKYGNYISGQASYNFAYAYGKASANSLEFFDNFYNLSGNVTIQEFPMDWDQRHTVTLNLDIRVPGNDHPRLFGLTLPDNFGLNVFWQYHTGQPYTPGKLHPGVQLIPGGNPAPYSGRLPASSNVDVRFNKDFKISSLSYTFEIWVNNLFDTRNVNAVYAETGLPTTDYNPEGVPYVSIRPPSPRNWDSGRQLRLGFGVNF